MSIAIK